MDRVSAYLNFSAERAANDQVGCRLDVIGVPAQAVDPGRFGGSRDKRPTPHPTDDELIVRLAYACQLLRIAPDAVKEHFIALFPEPGRPKMFAMIGYENDTWMFGVGAMAGLEPPGQCADMLSFAADFAPTHALDAIRAAEPLSDVVHHRVSSNRWRRYDKMRRTPNGLLVVGDAVCNFNPIYGQCMTLAAIEVTVLRDCLRSGERGLPRRFFRASFLAAAMWS